MATRTAWLVASLALGALAVLLMTWQRGEQSAASSAAMIAPVVAEPVIATAGVVRPAASASLTQWIQESSVLRGTELDGAWGVDATGQLQPGLGLRQRFDYLLQLLGQVPLEQITEHLRALAQKDLRQEQVGAVMDVWRRYLVLQQMKPQQGFNSADPLEQANAYARLKFERHKILGAQWAQAFYEQEDAQADARLEALKAPASSAQRPTTDLLIDRNSLPLAAQARLDEELIRQAAWQVRLAQARAQKAKLRDAPELSDLQRRQALDQWLNAQFKPQERLRVNMALGLGSAAE